MDETSQVTSVKAPCKIKPGGLRPSRTKEEAESGFGGRKSELYFALGVDHSYFSVRPSSNETPAGKEGGLNGMGVRRSAGIIKS